MSLREQLAARRASLENETTAPEVETEVENEIVDEAPENVEESTEESKEEPEVESTEEKPITDETPVSNSEKPESEVFVPDFKYRSDGKDLEIPEHLRSIIKDKDTQAKVIDMLQKSDAFESVSSKRDFFRTERDNARQETKRYESAINDLRSHVQRGDYDGFLKKCEIPEEAILKWATEKAKYYMGDESYRQQVDQANRMRQDSWAKESQVTDYQSKYQEMEVRQLQTEFNYEMLKPEVSSFAESFDKFAGKQGAFVEEIRNRGELAYLREQKTIAPSEVIQGIMKQFSSITQVAQRPQAAAPASAAAKVIVKPVSKVSTIPTVKGSQASPTKEGFTSLDQLRTYRKENYGK
jgi:hypothetical protein